jgi:hypothetical protein
MLAVAILSPIPQYHGRGHAAARTFVGLDSIGNGISISVGRGKGKVGQFVIQKESSDHDTISKRGFTDDAIDKALPYPSTMEM